MIGTCMWVNPRVLLNVENVAKAPLADEMSREPVPLIVTNPGPGFSCPLYIPPILTVELRVIVFVP